MASDPTIVTKIYEQIPLEALQQVADSYMAWYVDRVTRQLDDTMANLRAELRENDQKEASFRPSPLELDTIERLQRSGVTGVDLLDRMVEQGDDWLAVTMRRLDHFERTGLAPKDYSTWCEHALSGAYDWIDHDRLTPQGGGGRGGGGGQRTQAPSPNPGAAPSSVPGWLGGRNPTRNAAPASGDTATGPVPSAPTPHNAPSPGGPPPSPAVGIPSRPQSPATDADADGDASGRRNIFRIFTN